MIVSMIYSINAFENRIHNLAVFVALCLNQLCHDAPFFIHLFTKI